METDLPCYSLRSDQRSQWRLVDPDAKNSNRLRQALEELDAPGARSRPYAFPLTGTATSIGLPVILE